MGKKNRKKRKEGIFNYLMGGRFFISDIFTKNALLMGMIVVYSFIYVSNRYQHEQELVRIDKLTKRRNEIRNNLLILESDFAHKSSRIEELLNSGENEFQPMSTPYLIDLTDKAQ